MPHFLKNLFFVFTVEAHVWKSFEWRGKKRENTPNSLYQTVWLYVSAAHDGDGGHVERLSIRRASAFGWQPGEWHIITLHILPASFENLKSLYPQRSNYNHWLNVKWSRPHVSSVMKQTPCTLRSPSKASCLMLTGSRRMHVAPPWGSCAPSVPLMGRIKGYREGGKEEGRGVKVGMVHWQPRRGCLCVFSH